jgi:hypothetical protein
VSYFDERNFFLTDQVSLCIYQDDLEDWNREGAEMSSIYANAYLTIAAALAKDTTAGCFNHRAPKQQVRLDYSSHEGIRSEVLASLFPIFDETEPKIYAEMRGCPLVSRAWGLQERLLSRRILHFCKEQTYFECKEGFLSESGLFNIAHYSSIDLSHMADPKSVYIYWSDILFHQYSNRLLTKSSDKLPALAGLARLFSEKLADDYLAGLWKKSLIKCLFWDIRRARTLSYYRAPSWSWASLDGRSSMSFLFRTNKQKEFARLIDSHMELKGNNPFGEVKSGWIKLQAPLLSLYLTGKRTANPDGNFISERPLVVTENGSDEFEAEFDTEDFLEDIGEEGSKRIRLPKSMKLFALILEKGQMLDDKPRYYCVIASPIEKASLTMRRLGIIRIEAQKLRELEYLDTPVNWPIITLI